MPELPEVETICRSLALVVCGHTITGVTVRRASVLQDDVTNGAAFEACLTGQQILRLQRRAKYIVMEFSKGWLLCHMGMTGKFLIRNADYIVEKHDHVIFELDDQNKVVFNDVRRFGGIGYWRSNPFDGMPLCKLGPEPLEEGFTAAYLKVALQGRKSPVKTMLLDQHIVAGIGNIYADEILFEAGVRPRKASARVTLRECEAIVEATRHILADAIEAGGSTIRDYVDSQMRKGGYQFAHKVYGREGEACVNCGTTLKGVRIAGRSSVYCPHCQKS